MSLKNKNKNNYIPKRLTKTKLLVLGSLLFSLGIGTGVTATYAWYSLKEISSIQNLNLSIDAKKDTFLKLHLETDEGLIHKEEGYTKKDLGIEGKELTDVSGTQSFCESLSFTMPIVTSSGTRSPCLM